MMASIRPLALFGLLFVARGVSAEMLQVRYTESIQPDVRISASSSIAGLSLHPAAPVATGDTVFWVKLPPSFAGSLVVELTTHDHRFQATATFQGDAPGGWQKLEVAPIKTDGKSSKLAAIDLNLPTTAVRAWIQTGTEIQARRFVLVRWGAASDPQNFSAESLRVQLNLGTAPEAAAWLKGGKVTEAAKCSPADERSRSHVFFQWVCDFKGGLDPALASPSDSVLIVKRRERDGRELEELLRPTW